MPTGTATRTPTPAGLSEAVYGLPELFRDRIPAAGLIANPGCYTSTSILALAPLIAEDLIERTGIIIDAKSGVSGAGRSPKLNFHFPECNESLSAYNVGRHRHTPEIDQVLTTTTGGRGEPVEVIFTPHLVPMDRGIFATIYATPEATGRRARPARALSLVLRRQPVRPGRQPPARRRRTRPTPTSATSPSASSAAGSWSSPASTTSSRAPPASPSRTST